jgi:NADPH-dependent F420 reductase
MFVEKNMETKVSIIGAGKMATGMAKRLAAAGVPVVIGARDLAKAEALAKAAGKGVRFAGVADAGKQADLVVLAVPYDAMGDTLKALGNVAGKILMDISNPITADYMALTIGHTTSAAEEIQKLAPQSRVVKAFNTIFSQIFDLEPKAGGTRVQVFYASDDKAAGDKVAECIAAMGYEAVFSGPLSNARYLEPVGELNIHLGFALGHGTLVAPAWLKAAA